MEGALARVEVDARDAPALTRQRHREMHGAGRFARAALFIGKDDAVWCGRRREASHGALRFSCWRGMGGPRAKRSEEHTSELQSLMRLSYAVFCLKKKNT